MCVNAVAVRLFHEQKSLQTELIVFKVFLANGNLKCRQKLLAINWETIHMADAVVFLSVESRWEEDREVACTTLSLRSCCWLVEPEWETVIKAGVLVSRRLAKLSTGANPWFLAGPKIRTACYSRPRFIRIESLWAFHLNNPGLRNVQIFLQGDGKLFCGFSWNCVGPPFHSTLGTYGPRIRRPSATTHEIHVQVSGETSSPLDTESEMAGPTKDQRHFYSHKFPVNSDVAVL